MIHQQPCGGFLIPDRFERTELILLAMALCIAQEQAQNRKLREQLIVLEDKIFGDNEQFMNELDQLLQ